MLGPRAKGATVALVLVVLVFSSLVPVSGTPAPHTTSRSDVPLASSVPASGTPRLPERSLAVAPGGGAPLRSSLPKSLVRAPSPAPNSADAKIERLIAAGRLKAEDVFFPSALVHSGPSASGPVAPGYLTSPAPMGLADFGLSSSGAYVYNTTSFEGTVVLAAFSAFSPGYAAFEQAPDWATFSLDTVAVNVSYPGATDGTFWAQNVVHYNGSELQLEDNIWNFSGPNATVNTTTLLGPHGTIIPGAFYYDFGPAMEIRPPFTLRLFNNVSIVGGHPEVFFNYSISNVSGLVRAGSYDQVVFNGSASSGHPPQFQVDGDAYNPYGLLNDAELVVAGQGGGANANLLSLNATETLDAWNSTSGAYGSVRSAYDFGSDTAETSLGIGVYYAGTTAYLNQGPSFLYGLWNTSSTSFAPSAPAGSKRIEVTLTPDYGFLFATYNSSLGASLAADEFSYAPTNATGVMIAYLPPPVTGNPYVFEGWADGNSTLKLEVNSSSGPQDLVLPRLSSELDAPVYLMDNAQAAAFGGAGIAQTGYSASSSELWINASSDDLAAPFLRLNDFHLPTFVLLATAWVNTSVAVNAFEQAAASFAYTTSSGPIGGPTVSIPGWTQGYYFFYGSGAFSVSNVTVSGNATQDSTQVRYPPGAIEFYGTRNSGATDIAVTEDSFGAVAVDSRSLTFAHLSASLGASAISAVNSSSITASFLTSSGGALLAAILTASTAANLSSVVDAVLSSVSASGGSIGVLALNATELTIHGLTTATGAEGFVGENIMSLAITDATLADSATGIFLSNASGVALDDLAVEGVSFGLDINNTSRIAVASLSVGPDGSAGFVTNSTQVTVDGISLLDSVGPGLELVLDRDRSLTVQDVNATGAGVSAIVLSNSTYANVSDVAANGGAVGIALNSDRAVRVTGVLATGGSVGAMLGLDAGVTAINLTARSDSIALIGANCSDGALSWANVTDGSVGAYLSNSTNFTLTELNGTESVLAPLYFMNPASGTYFPSAVVAVDNDSNVTVTGVSSIDYPYGVLGNNSTDVAVTDVTSWGGNYSVALNNTTEAGITEDFAFGGQVGVYLVNVTSSSLAESTLEDEVVDGLVIQNGTTVTVFDNNFIANNGSSTNGVFNAAHRQASITENDSGFFALDDNYWSDRSSGAYSVGDGFSDSSPRSAPVPYWLRFEETGLPANVVWGFSYLAVPYQSSRPVIYLPDWSLPTGGHRYAVIPTPGYLETPASGTVTFVQGENQTVVISYAKLYNVTFTESGLPSGTLWNVTVNDTVEKNVTVGASGSIVFGEVNGDYTYTVGPVAGYHLESNAYSKAFAVSGADRTFSLVWVAYTYAVTFTETGLPTGTTWSVKVNTTLEQAPTASLIFEEANGTYEFTVPGVPGYTANLTQGYVTVDGNVVNVAIGFNGTGVVSSSGVPVLDYVVVGVVLVVIVAGVVLFLRRRSERGP